MAPLFVTAHNLLHVYAGRIGEPRPGHPNSATLPSHDGMVDTAVRMNVLKESQAESKPLLAKAAFLSKRGTLMCEQMLAQVFQAVHQALRNQYVLTYSSSNKKHDGAFRKIKVELVNPATNELSVSRGRGDRSFAAPA